MRGGKTRDHGREHTCTADCAVPGSDSAWRPSTGVPSLKQQPRGRPCRTSTRPVACAGPRWPRRLTLGLLRSNAQESPRRFPVLLPRPCCPWEPPERQQRHPDGFMVGLALSGAPGGDQALREADGTPWAQGCSALLLSPGSQASRRAAPRNHLSLRLRVKKKRKGKKAASAGPRTLMSEILRESPGAEFSQAPQVTPKCVPRLKTTRYFFLQQRGQNTKAATSACGAELERRGAGPTRAASRGSNTPSVYRHHLCHSTWQMPLYSRTR